MNISRAGVRTERKQQDLAGKMVARPGANKQATKTDGGNKGEYIAN
jgi:hypothetical protein